MSAVSSSLQCGLRMAVAGAISVVSLCASATPALAANGLIGSFSGPGANAGELAAPGQAAVVSSTGRVFVTDSGNDRIQVFNPADDGASYSTEFGAGVVDGPFGIAIDQSTGAVYVSDADDVVKFDGTGSQDPSFTSPGVTGPLTVDPSTGDLLIADQAADVIRRYSSSGTPDGSFDGASSPGGAFTGLLDIAADATGDIVAIDAPTGSIDDLVTTGTSRVERFDPTGDHQATIGPVDGGAGALSIDPDGDRVVVAGNFSSYVNSANLRLHIYAPDGTAVDAFDLPAPTLWGVVTGVAAAGQGSDRIYAFTDLYQGFGATAGHAFYAFDPVAPAATTGGASSVTEAGAKLTGQVNPKGEPTSYWFEYGETTDYGQRVPGTGGVEAGSGISAIQASKQALNLPPVTTYHYRIVAQNSVGTTYGNDATFKTDPVSVAGQPKLPDGRAYEMVSPPDKNGNNAGYVGVGMFGSDDGERLVFPADASSAFGDAAASVTNHYVASRGVAGWSSHAVTPPTAVYAPGALRASFVDFACDLCTTVVGLNHQPGGPEDQDADVVGNPRADVFRSGGRGTYEWLSRGSIGGDGPSHAWYMGRSADGSHVAFDVGDALEPGTEVVPAGTRIAYERFGDVTRVVGVHDDETVMSGGSTIAAGARSLNLNAVSADGSEIFFQSPAGNGGHLYVRVDGEHTVEVSAPQCTVPSCDGTGVVQDGAGFAGASRDGNRVYFQSLQRLTDDDVNADPDLYLYELDSSRLTRVSRGHNGSGSVTYSGPLGVSDDGSSVYFYSAAILTTGPNANGDSPELNENNLYRWQIGPGPGSTEFVSTLYGGLLSYEEGARHVDMTRDGSVMVVAGDPTGQSFDQVYRYHAVSRSFDCLSCAPVVGDLRHANLGDERGGADAGYGGQGVRQMRVRNLDQDGNTVFFETASALVASDSNNRIDVYRWNASGLALITSGRSKEHSHLVDSGADGRDVFFTTSERLVSEDRDWAIDIYDARVGGGFPATEIPDPCSGDVCQGVGGSRPALPAPRSEGLGNDPPASSLRTTLSLSRLSAAQRRRLAGGGVVALRVVVPRAGRVALIATARLEGRTRVVGRATSKAVRRGPLKLRLRLRSTARRALAREGSLRIALAVRIGRATARQRLVLRPVAQSSKSDASRSSGTSENDQEPTQ